MAVVWYYTTTTMVWYHHTSLVSGKRLGSEKRMSKSSRSRGTQINVLALVLFFFSFHSDTTKPAHHTSLALSID